MAGDSYLELLGQEGYKQFEDAKKSAKEIGDIVVSTNGKIVEMFNSLKSNTSFKDYNKQAEETKRLIAELDAKTKAYEKTLIAEAKAETEASKARLNDAKALTEKAKAQKLAEAESRAYQNELKKEQKEIKELDNAYKILSNAYGTALEKYKNLAAQYPQNHVLVQQAANDAKVLNERLKEIDAGVGNYQRNVGNYSSAFNGLKISINQLASEIPNFAQSMRIGIMSVGNNITQLGQSIEHAKNQNALLMAQGKQAIPIWTQVAKALLSWQTALVIGVTLLTAYGERIWEAIKGTTEFERRQKELNKIVAESSTSYSKTAAEIEILRNRFEQAGASAKTKQEVIVTLNKKYGDTIGQLKGINDAEEFFINRSDAFVKSLMIRAQIEGAYDKIAENTKKRLENEQKGVSELTTAYDKFVNGLTTAVTTPDPFVGLFGGIKKQFQKLQSETAIINFENTKTELNKSDDAIKDFVNSALTELSKLEEKAGLGSGKEGGKALKFNSDLLKAKVQQEARAEQLIFEDEKLLYTARLAARARYSKDLIQIVELEKNAELKNAKTVEERLTIESQAATKIKDIRLDEAKFNEGIIEKTATKRQFTLIKGLDAELKDINDANEQKLRNEEKYARESDRISRQSAELKKRLYQEIANTAFGLADAVIEKDLEKLDRDSENIDISRQREIDAINASTISEEQKQERITNAERTAADAKAAIEKEKINLERKRFYVEKANAAANVTITALKDIAAIKGQAAILAANPVTAALAPLALAQVPIVAGTSAAALGLILGQIALYGDGTDSHKGGDAIIGERFEPEWVEKNGKGYWVTKPTYVKDLAAGTRVTPLHDIVGSTGGLSPALIHSIQSQQDNRLLGKIDELKDVIRNKPETSYVQENGSMTKKIKMGNRVVTYLDKNIYW